jgi:hypothetical protein
MVGHKSFLGVPSGVASHNSFSGAEGLARIGSSRGAKKIHPSVLF